MSGLETLIINEFENFSGIKVINILTLPQSGGERNYFRLQLNDTKYPPSIIATFSNNIQENNFFIYCTKHFLKFSLCVPVIYHVNKDATIYFQEDFGNLSLLEYVVQYGFTDNTISLYKKALINLAELQVKGNIEFDYSKCIISSEYNAGYILKDLNYFREFFLDILNVKYDKEILEEEFILISKTIDLSVCSMFMFRDFQGRNILIDKGDVKFIDYQGGMKGPAAYDVASLLWQAKAAIPKKIKEELLTYYMNYLATLISFDESKFRKSFNELSFLRMIQVLGAYGFRGLIEKKPHFISSINQGLQNLESFQESILPGTKIPELRRIIKIITEKNFMEKRKSALAVTINSFSFITRGYPEDSSGNGGGFVFDCRGILNPGRIEKFKMMTGRDEEVIAYLQSETQMDKWLQSVFEVVDVTVENYIERNFSNLNVSFGCTGGRHRSVYAADQLALHLKEKFGINTSVNHLEQNF